MSLAPAIDAPFVLGAPGIFITTPAPLRALVGVRRDVAAFLGVAPRGPCRIPADPLEPDVDAATFLAGSRVRRSVAVSVTSWDEYRSLFGAFEGPGRLPYAVSAFFAGGGRQAYVVRIVHDHGDAVQNAAGRAQGSFAAARTRASDPRLALTTTAGAPVALLARSEGTWGNRLAATLRFSSRPIIVHSSAGNELHVDRREWVPVGSLLRLTVAGGLRELVYVDGSEEVPNPAGAGVSRVLRLGAPTAATPDAEVITASLVVMDRDTGYPRRETMADIGLRADHPRWFARVLINESTLVWPESSWAAGTLQLTDLNLPSFELDDGTAETHMTGGTDRWQHITPDDFFDPHWVDGDETPGDGVHCLVENDEIGLLLAPDLYDPFPLDPIVDVTDVRTLCGAEFEEHIPFEPGPPPTPAIPGLDGLRVDFADIVAAQQRLVDEAERRRDLTVLLDVSPGLSQRRAIDWRNEFDSSFAAAYHPWLDVAAPDDDRDALVRVNPSAFAAAIIAERELRLGVQHGPANEIAVGAVRVADVVTPAHHDELHLAGVNVFRPERNGIRLTAARTLSRHSELRQLSVARLMTILRLTLLREMQWAVFEPNNRELWADVRRLVHDLLTGFYGAGAFEGATTKDAFFVTCDETTMTRNDLDNGRLVCLVGVAPVEPTEYLLIEIALAADSGVRVEVVG